MIITCEECSTRFELDESRIPVTGARVRCSCCKHAFFLPNPTASASEAADSIAAAAAADDAVGLPTPASDLTSEVASGAASSSPEAEIEEEDWEFSEVIRSEDDDDFDAEEDPGAEDDFDPEPDFDRSFDASNLSEDHGEDDLDVVGTADEQPGVGALD
ncbi:MAG: zinc-ribbon domain-containing protein [Deltaproteobacteria bacterium]|nr:zinc-ribbon domain-containing protein [Deltaproteobacteria bacterium]